MINCLKNEISLATIEVPTEFWEAGSLKKNDLIS